MLYNKMEKRGNGKKGEEKCPNEKESDIPKSLNLARFILCLIKRIA